MNLEYTEKNTFFGNVHSTSNKYFLAEKQVSDDGDQIILITNNVRSIKGNPVLVINNNQAVYLKDFNIAGVGVKTSNGEYLGDSYAVKLNSKFFKAYTFKSDFEDISFEEADTFESLKTIAKEQEEAKNQYSTHAIEIYYSTIEKH